MLTSIKYFLMHKVRNIIITINNNKVITLLKKVMKMYKKVTIKSINQSIIFLKDK